MDVIVNWTVDAKISHRKLLRYIAEQPYGNPIARDREIQEAIQRLRKAPYGCRVVHIREGKEFRRMVTSKGRFFVYYIYYPPQCSMAFGYISIRAIKHAALQRPFAGVREPAVAFYGGY